MTTASGTIYFHYSGDKVVYETNENNNIIAEYTYDAQGNPATIIKNGVTYYYHVNGHGDVMALTDESGNVVAEYNYDAYGNIVSQSGSMASANPLRYAGYRYDEATGLYYLMARYYDANVGRFITRDTFHGFEDEPKSLNQYNYSHSNPVIYFDPSGHASILVRPNFKTGTDITTDFINYMKLNAEYARNMAKKLSYGERLSWFKNLVANKQPWDLKQTLKGHYKFMGKIVTGADLGNIHYGFVGTAVGFSETVLLLGAGYAQLRAGTSSWKFVFSNFDDPWDQKMISCGIKLYNPIMNHSIKAI